jgi:hypothetical protein
VALAEAGEPGSASLFFSYALAIFTIINGVAYSVGKGELVGPMVAGTLLVGVVLPLLNGRPLLWPELTVQTLALGNRNAIEVVVSYKQCQSFAKFGMICDYKENKDNEISLNNVNILSRVGTSVLLELLVDTHVRKASSQPLDHLSTTERGRYCGGEGKRNTPGLCSQCDSLTLKKATLDTSGEIAADAQQRLNSYQHGLACVQISIPKDQVTSMSLSGSRRYLGFTRIIEPTGTH